MPNGHVPPIFFQLGNALKSGSPSAEPSPGEDGSSPPGGRFAGHLGMRAGHAMRHGECVDHSGVYPTNSVILLGIFLL